MPALPMLPKGHAKVQLSTYFAKLEHGVDDKPRLAAALKNDMDKWTAELDAVPDSSEPLPLPVNQNENEAFLNRIKANAAKHDDLLGHLQDMEASGTAYGKSFLKRLRTARGQVEQDVQQWDTQQANYERNVNAYAQRNADKQSDYHENLKALRVRLEAMRVRYNQRYMFEELLDDESRRSYFLDSRTCLGYVPGQHCWKPNVGEYQNPATKAVTKGTYMYDFPANAFQLHIHCNPYNGDVRAIRVKLYGEEHGKCSNSKADNQDVATAFRNAYPPDATGNWVQVV